MGSAIRERCRWGVLLGYHRLSPYPLDDRRILLTRSIQLTSDLMDQSVELGKGCPKYSFALSKSIDANFATSVEQNKARVFTSLEPPGT